MTRLDLIGGGLPSGVAVSSDGTSLAVASSAGVYLYEGESLGFVLRFDTEIWAFAAAFDPGGQRLAVGGMIGGVSLTDVGAPSIGVLQVLDVESGEVLVSLNGLSNAVQSVAFGPDGRLVAATGGDDNLVRLVDSVAGVVVLELGGHMDFVSSVLFSPDGRNVVSSSLDRTIRIWEVESGGLLDTIRTDLLDMAISLDGHELTSVSGVGEVRTWNLETGDQVSVIGHAAGFPEVVLSADFSEDATRLAVGTLDGNVEVWNMELGEQIRTIPTTLRTGNRTGTVYTLTMTPDGDGLLAINNEDHVIHKWDIGLAISIASIEGYASSVTSLAFDPNSSLLAVGHFNGPVRIWDAESRRLLRILRGHADVVHLLYFEDSDVLASAGDDNAFRRWSSSSGEMLSEDLGSSLRGISFGFGSGLVAFNAGGGMLEVADFLAQETLFRLRAGNIVALQFSTRCCAWYLASGTLEGRIKVWEMAGGEQVLDLEAHVGPVVALAFSPDRRLIASADGQQAVRVWEIATGELLAELEAPGVTALAFAPDGRSLATGGFDGAVGLWGVAP
jgi:WD40 repeat protein